MSTPKKTTGETTAPGQHKRLNRRATKEVSAPSGTSATTAAYDATHTGSGGVSGQPTRLIPALPGGAFVTEPEEINRFVVRISPDGDISFRGSRERIDVFLRACAEVGLETHVDHIALCG